MKPSSVQTAGNMIRDLYNQLHWRNRVLVFRVKDMEDAATGSRFPLLAFIEVIDKDSYRRSPCRNPVHLASSDAVLLLYTAEQQAFSG